MITAIISIIVAENASLQMRGNDEGGASLVDAVRELRSHYWPLIHAAGRA